ncbi:MAG: hypothetical protein RLZZ618_3969, partial [Pseudomonadota bacterium]
MHTLTLRIYLTLVAVLLFFAFTSGWVMQRQLESERSVVAGAMAERMSAWGDLIERSLPDPEEPEADQAAALLAWSHRLRLPLALDSAQGKRIAASESYVRRRAEDPARDMAVRLEDGRTLWMVRPDPNRPGRLRQRGADERAAPPPSWLGMPPMVYQRGVGMAVGLVVLFVAVALAAWPAVRRLTRRLKLLQRGVEQFGAGQLSHRVEVSG